MMGGRGRELAHYSPTDRVDYLLNAAYVAQHLYQDKRRPTNVCMHKIFIDNDATFLIAAIVTLTGGNSKNFILSRATGGWT